MAVVTTNGIPFTVEPLVFDGTPMTAELYEQDGVTKIRDLTLASGMEFTLGERQDGKGSLTLPVGTAELTDVLADEPRIIRFLLGGSARMDAYVTRTLRQLSDEEGGRVKITAPGLRWALKLGAVLPYHRGCPFGPGVSQRILGAPDPNYDVSGLPGVTVYGKWKDQDSFFPAAAAGLRAPQFPDPDAKFITHGTGSQPPGPAWAFSPTFSVLLTGDYVLAVAGDDEYEAYLVGSLVGSSYGEFSWTVTDLHKVRLCAGLEYRLVIKYNNLDRTEATGAPDSYAWAIASLVYTDIDTGEPAAANQTYDLYVTPGSGAFTLTVAIPGEPAASTPGIADSAPSSAVQAAMESLPNVGAGNVVVSGSGTPYTDHRVQVHSDATAGQMLLVVNSLQTNLFDVNASAATVKARIEELPGIDTVTVSGTGDAGTPWDITFDGPGVSGQSHSVTAVEGTGFNGTAITVTNVASGSAGDPYGIEFTGTLANTDVDVTASGAGVTLRETQVGGASVAVIRTDESWRVLAYPDEPPGLNPGVTLRALVEEGAARGVQICNWITFGFTDTHDSKNVPWDTDVFLPVPTHTSSIHDVAAMIEQRGIDVWIAPGWVLHAAQSRGVDRTGTVDLTGAKLGRQTTWASEHEVRNVLFFQDADGVWYEEEDAASVAVHGRCEEPYSVPEADYEVARQWAQAGLEDAAAQYREFSLIVVPESGDPYPFNDFDWADLILGPAMQAVGQTATLRVATVTASQLDVNNVTEYTAEVVQQ